MKKVAVLGCAGFLGSHLVEALSQRGDQVIGYDNLSRGVESARNLLEIKGKCEVVIGDILDFPKLKSTVKSGLDVVFHLAALPSHRLALEQPYDYLNIDLMGTANVLEATRLCNPKPLIVFASSNKVYGKQECPWREDKLPQPEGPYAVAKWASEKMCEMYNKYFDVPCVVIRYHHVAGPRSNPDLALSIFVEQALENEPIEVHGEFKNGIFTSCSADYTHVDDAIRATLLAVDAYYRVNIGSFEIINIANKKLVTVEDIAKEVVISLKSLSEIKYVPMLPHETLVHSSDVSKAEEKLGFVAEIPVKGAIEDYIEWRLKK